MSITAGQTPRKPLVNDEQTRRTMSADEVRQSLDRVLRSLSRRADDPDAMKVLRRTRTAMRRPLVREPRVVELPEYTAMVVRLLDSMGARAGDADPESLRLFQTIRAAVDSAEHEAMDALVENGYSYADMGRALGVSKVAVHKRHHRGEMS